MLRTILQPYTLNTHRHRFAVWTSARAVARNFTATEYIERAIKLARLRAVVERGASFHNQASFDTWHANTCNDMLQYWLHLSQTVAIKALSFGRAATVVAVYFKTSVGMREPGTHPMPS